jgi:hypothetical protein
MKYNLLIVANKPGENITMLNQEYDSYGAAVDAKEALTRVSNASTTYSFQALVITAKGEENA